jgi:hypothetical protein
VAPWVAWVADFEAGPGVSGPATVVITAPDAAQAGEPWFVRVRDYQGLGSALAWESPTILAPGEVLHRTFVAAIADGRLTESETGRLADQLIASRS